MEVMNLYSATVGTLKRFATRHWPPRIKRTYVFILVPFDFSQKNGHAKKAEVAQHLLENRTDSGGARSGAIAGLTAFDRLQIRFLGESTNGRELNGEPKLNFDLMWTWFLSNPL
jgi:hypothetical protein